MRTLTCPYCGKQYPESRFKDKKGFVYLSCINCRGESDIIYTTNYKHEMDIEFKIVRLSVIIRKLKLKSIPLLSKEAELLIQEKNFIRL